MHSVYMGQLNQTVQSLIKRQKSAPLEMWVETENGSYPFCLLRFIFFEIPKTNKNRRMLNLAPFLVGAFALMALIQLSS